MPICDLVQVVPIGARLALVDPPRVDPERVEQELDVLGPPLADDGEADASALGAVVALDR